MAIAVERGYASGSNASATANLDVAIPTAVDVGDWILVFIVTSTATTTVATPTGWTLIAASGAVNTRNFYLFGKRKATGDSATQTFTQASAQLASWTLTYGSGGLTNFAQWVTRQYANDTGQNYPMDRRYTYYVEKGGASSPAGTAATTRVRGMAVPAKSLVLTVMGEATSASETEAQVTLTQGAAKWFYYGGGSSINTHWWSKEYTTTAKTTDDVIVKWPNDNNANGAGIQVAIPELVDTAPVVNFQTGFESGNPLTVGTTANFETTTVSPRKGTTALRRVNNGSFNSHSQVAGSDSFTVPTSGLRAIGYVRTDSSSPFSLAGISFGVAADGTGGVQVLVDSRNGTGGPSVSSIQLRTGTSTVVAGLNVVGAIVSGVVYRIEADLRSDGYVIGRVYEDVTDKFIGKVEGATSVTSGRFGVYGYGAVTYDDLSLSPIPSAPRLSTKMVLPDQTISNVAITYLTAERKSTLLALSTATRVSWFLSF
ncbi:hypothetical protein CMP1-20 [Clavibacter phage CMP1]|uniref:Uncharacterized protein n=1 Tax=Clavibacter phage CMP1 TaxID=686439 RepID=D0U204_9CAUD|nr:hypothetical protein CMP1-20 [Clavibacter phage CMP1]ACY35916.1 hypothetical protein CMP1-20 [Clavibacter phage CMP1]